MAAMMRYCALSARSAENVESSASAASVARPTVRASRPVTYGSPEWTSASAKPAA